MLSLQTIFVQFNKQSLALTAIRTKEGNCAFIEFDIIILNNSIKIFIKIIQFQYVYLYYRWVDISEALICFLFLRFEFQLFLERSVWENRGGSLWTEATTEEAENLRDITKKGSLLHRALLLQRAGGPPNSRNLNCLRLVPGSWLFWGLKMNKYGVRKLWTLLNSMKPLENLVVKAARSLSPVAAARRDAGFVFFLVYFQ